MDVREVQVPGWERVVVARDGEYHGIVAVHSTALGTALGGTRLWRYAAEADALDDALRLSRGMTYKNALAGLDAGGGKSVILAPARIDDRAALFRAHARVVDMLGGTYITAEDVGTTPADMDTMAAVTPHVAGVSSGIGDPSPHTARGVFRALQAAVAHRFGAGEVAGMTVAVQGTGNVGAWLVRLLREAGANVVVADVDADRAAAVAEEHGTRVVSADAIYDVEADVFAPCALGGILNVETISRLRASVVAGGANNQLRDADDGARLAARGIVYAPDYVANAGGVITGYGEMAGWTPAQCAARVDAIHDTVRDLLRRADTSGILPHEAADRMVEERLAAAKG
ncbi:Leu/Phe/Val dehydrogenase [Longimicrobium sp.]|uniref:Leu/Phe/Val dehydrogenase n=1 Tax=Longimicrobium sp. TaxID=2029185 RepID=UPI002E34E190|nr:Glu/Leu/Phe/Val dehydrogenase dimerization domain-containing protein [Longimicrobium sp.]HEX6038924.1 Glu/Leu/Phe/Val dehydrogenase dimerization domain-containing protein [Longimicrobium sp.]